MRFDDTLDTVLSIDLSNAAAACAAWRQIVDLVGRARVPINPTVLRKLEALRSRVPTDVRAASARALADAHPPAALVALLARDELAVAAPVLRSADLAPSEWAAILPALSPTARAVLRHRRDLPADTVRALQSFGAVDFVLTRDGAALDAAAPSPALPERAAKPAPFVTIGDVARDIVGRVRERGNDNPLPPAPVARPDGTFHIADVVARIEAYRRRHDSDTDVTAEPARPPLLFQFEADTSGIVQWVDASAREPLVGTSLAQPAHPGRAGVDAGVAGAFRQRARFTAGRLLVAGTSEVAGDWTIAGAPVFEQASGRFVGYRGTARRPRSDERARLTAPVADAVRQLVHELRTPTNAIVGFSEMIAHEVLGPVAEPYREQALAIRTDVGSLLAAIDDLDTAARLDTGALTLRREPVRLAPLLARIERDLAPLCALRGAALAIDTTDAVVDSDTPALARLLERWIAVMVGAAEQGERIRIRTLSPDEPVVRVAIDRPTALAKFPGTAVLDVNDETSAASLLGLGFTLRLVRNLAHQLGGGMRFGERRLTLSLPAAVDRAMERIGQG